MLNQNCYLIHDIAINTLDNAPDTAHLSINCFQLEQDKEQVRLQEFTNMQNTVAEFTLNHMQSTYKIVARHSLEDESDQLCLYIVDPGRTGKSCIIDALCSFFNKKNQAHPVRMASFTGVASQNIHGMTLHSATRTYI